jgi:hypothetical protein
MSKKDETKTVPFGTISIPDDLIREFYRAAAVGGIIAHEGTGKTESILPRAFAIADEAMKWREMPGE